jgi:hypothetical protein
LLASPLRWHGSSDFVGFARADALIHIVRGVTVKENEVVKILFI